MSTENYKDTQKTAFNTPAAIQVKPGDKIIPAKVGKIRPGGRLQRDMDQFTRVG